jgi:hypothetical protein
MFSETLHLVALFRTDVSENVLSPSSEVLRLMRFHRCITVETLLLSLSIERYNYSSKNPDIWDAFTAIRCLLGLCVV